MKNKLHSVIERTEYTAGYELRFLAEIKHLGLGKYRILRDKESAVLQNKISAQFQIWDALWEKQELKRQKYEAKADKSALAKEKTLEAALAQKELNEILLAALRTSVAVNWSTLKDRSKFKKPNPMLSLEKEIAKITAPVKKPKIVKPPKPYPDNFAPKLGFLDKLLPSRRKKRIEEGEAAYKKSLSDWHSKCEKCDEEDKKNAAQFKISSAKYKEEVSALKEKYSRLEESWKAEEQKFIAKQKENNLIVDELKKKYLSNDEQAVMEYCEMVLNSSCYPEYFPKDFELQYQKDTGILVVEFVLPEVRMIPTLKEVRYVASKDELKEFHLTEAQQVKIYDDVIYKIVLRTLYELFEADKGNAIAAVIFNGWVESVNKGTGRLVNSCIVSIKADKTQFTEIDLTNVDPKTCFKNLKGIGSSKLSGMVPVQPILQIDKSDRRFVDSYDVADTIQGENLATMSWEDFEHLIREIFEKEFSVNGGEVKVTQASRDGGVDAVAFDPDPIRGGKIVIQAKRYTNTVGVSAVRDLYGTVMNEGATKGILVTTADYGPDAYTFAQNKPLTLLNGANLLYLLEKHGYSGRIDIREAKQILKDSYSR